MQRHKLAANDKHGHPDDGAAERCTSRRLTAKISRHASLTGNQREREREGERQRAGRTRVLGEAMQQKFAKLPASRRGIRFVSVSKGLSEPAEAVARGTGHEDGRGEREVSKLERPN